MKNFYGGLSIQALLSWSVLIAWSSPAAAQTQVVFLDFDSQTSVGEFDYTPAQRNDIEQRIASDYAAFDFAFTQTRPSAGDFSTLFFNAGPEFGLADDIDFRNLNRNDTASIFIDVSNGFTTTQFINFSASTAAHELGHLQGLRHGDSFGPIGAGIDPDTVFLDEYFPSLPAGIPQAADLTRFLLMESDFLFDTELNADQYFGQRSAVKLSFNERGTVTPEQASPHQTFSSAQLLSLPTIAVPNTLIGVPEFEGMDFFADIEVVTASITDDETDVYRFEAQAGDLFNVEVISETNNRLFTDTFDSTLAVFDADGNPLDYYGEDAFNDDEFESFESILIDLPIPTDGTYYIEVESFGPGPYELLAYRFRAAAEIVGLLGDYTGNGRVEQGDLDLVLSGWGQARGAWENADGFASSGVDQEELDRVLSNWGGVAAPDLAGWAVPEPGLAGFCGLVLALGVKRFRVALVER